METSVVLGWILIIAMPLQILLLLIASIINNQALTITSLVIGIVDLIAVILYLKINKWF